MFYYIGLVIGAILVLLGLVGSILPVLPGPPLSFIGLLIFALVCNFSPPLTPTLIIIILIISIAVTVVDYFIPLIGAKKYGASKWGIYGSIGGMIIGAFFSPFGVLLGALVGAVLAQWMVSEGGASSKSRLGHFYRINLWDNPKIRGLWNNGLLFSYCSPLIYSLFKGNIFFQPGQHLILPFTKCLRIFLFDGFARRRNLFLRIDKLAILCQPVIEMRSGRKTG